MRERGYDMNNNPILCLDYPDPDVIRVDDTYYMISTTMYFMPGGVILRSYDLVHWEFASYVYDIIEDTQAHRLENGKNIYGKGMWAASLRYHKGTFYVCFVANEMQTTYLYQSENITGPWRKQTMEGFYHDCSLFFDEDDRVYIVYGNKKIHLTELESDLSGPKKNGFDGVIIEDNNAVYLGYEGAHMYKINGKYYVFMIHWIADGTKRRTEACYVSDSLGGTFTGKDVLNDDMGYLNQGVAQGGIVDTPDGDWYAVLFQDHGAVGRIPVLVPVHWENDFPVFGVDGRVPSYINVKSTRPDYKYQPLVGSDEFDYETNEEVIEETRLKPMWQWNHNPDSNHWNIVKTKNGHALRLINGKLSRNVCEAVNTLTQRMKYPTCAASVKIDASGIKDGDYAGICALQGCYGFIAVTREQEKFYLVMMARKADSTDLKPDHDGTEYGEEYARIHLNSPNVTLKVCVDFTNMRDEAMFYYKEENIEQWKQLGITHKLFFRLDHFTGCRFGLFSYATKQLGGIVDFSEFIYEE